MLGTSSFAPIPLDSPTGSAFARSPVEPPQQSPASIHFYSATQSPTNFTSAPSLQRLPTDGTEGTRSREHSNGSLFQPLEPVINGKDLSSGHFQRLREQSEGSYPSPAESSSDSPRSLHALSYKHLPTSNPDMRPPFSNFSQVHLFGMMLDAESTHPEEQRAKKMKHNGSNDFTEQYISNAKSQTQSYSPAPNQAATYRPPSLTQQNPFGLPYSSPTRVSQTPALSAGSDDPLRPFVRPSSNSSVETRDDRRVSVASLLSTPTGESANDRPFPGKLSITSTSSSDRQCYGIDRGLPDRDIPLNDDQDALSDTTPKLSYVDPMETTDLDAAIEEGHSVFGFGLDANDSEDFGTYYSRPVRVWISCALEPLPDELSQNPMNLLYFHHFLDHTARILVPHDCSENPFKNILPKSKQQRRHVRVCFN